MSTLYIYLHQTLTSDAEILKQEHFLCPFAQAACSHAYPARPSVTKVSSEVSTLGAADRVLLGGYSQGLTCCTLHGCFQTFPSCNLPHFSIFCIILPRSWCSERNGTGGCISLAVGLALPFDIGLIISQRGMLMKQTKLGHGDCPNINDTEQHFFTVSIYVNPSSYLFGHFWTAK